MDIKSNGIEVDVADSKGTHLGDLDVPMTSVIRSLFWGGLPVPLTGDWW